jgi:beta-galactosidase GanA
MIEPEWKVDKQPAWLVAAIKKRSPIYGGYIEAAEWLDVTENALFNRLRADGDQIFPSAGQWSAACWWC